MRHRSLLVLSVALTGALTVTACGSRGGSSGGSSSSGDLTVTIGVDAPLSGQNSATGLGIQYGVQIAVDDANKNNTVPGVKFKVKALDDQAQPGIGQQNATALVGDSSVLGVIGPLNSGVAQSMQQVFQTADLVEISPSNTNPALTQGPNWASGNKVRPFKTYFRTATTDALQGAFAAQYAYDTAGKRKAFVVDDKQDYGAGLASIFQSSFTKDGGSIAGTDHVNTGDKDFSTLVTKIKNSGADMLYYGGQYDEAQLITKQLKDAGANIPLMGGDGIYSATYITTAGTEAEGDLATSVGIPVDTLPSAQDFVAKYKAAKYPGDYGTYGGYSYDAALAIIKSIGKSMGSGGKTLPTRAQVVTGVQNADFDGIAGHVSFDQYGDTTDKQLTVYQVKSGKWVSVKTGSYTG
ncbi:branched-chain amino acid ABC transporter substrate-binding protein [Kitasatospora viridis]|uniref:branched-chain amino acid ABC transporter substrate-binding protein n=1 Tax=Kitasatospora viridis TaxID=281105 RepID=UPI001FEAA00E|nr:branched-chain amino acid ABC transporter substrate-binding protein [Kitasatospora viridis]